MMDLTSQTKSAHLGCGKNAAKPNQPFFLPIAPQFVARTRFSPPIPVRSHCLLVPEALELLDRAMNEREEGISMVAIAGPGDPLATPEITLKAITLVRQRYPAVRIAIKTLGIGSERLAGDLARAGLDYVEMQVDGIKTAILEKIYAWIRPAMRTLKVAEAAEVLIREQRNGVSALCFHNIAVNILFTLYPGLNIDHAPKLAAAMMVLGAGGIGLIPYQPEPGTEVPLLSPSEKTIQTVRKKIEESLPVITPLLLETSTTTDPLLAAASQLPRPTEEKPYVAVASSNGIDIDLHLGRTSTFLLYGKREDGLACLLETRSAPPPGSGSERWQQLAAILGDCFAVVAASAGDNPQRVLASCGIKVLLAENAIEGMVDVLFGGGKKKKNGNMQNRRIGVDPDKSNKILRS